MKRYRSKTFPISPLALRENRLFHTFSVMGSSNTNVPLYPSLENGSARLTILSLSKERGKGRFYQHNFKIPLYPPLPKGDKKPRNRGVTHEEGNVDTVFHGRTDSYGESSILRHSRGEWGEK
jgi:hypothetical protein